MLLDSNIIIYAAQPEYATLRAFIAQHAPAVSAISYLEVLDYHRLTEQERQHFEAFFAAATMHPLSLAVVEQAIRLRQERKMSLGDALIAATVGSTPIHSRLRICQSA
jgi:toxin FitB